MTQHNINLVVSARDHASRTFRRIATAAAAYLSFRAVTSFVKESARAFLIQEEASRKLEQALIATGGAIGYTTKELQEYADQLQKSTVYGDEQVESMMSILATFKNVQGEAFKRTTELALDLSYAMGQDLKSSAVQLGKALNDPVKGITALTRVGVSFTQQQIEQVKQLAAANQMYEAQKIVLDEVAAQFGGQAQAAAQTFGGQIKQLGNAWSDAKEKIGEYLMNNETFQNVLDVTIVALQNLGLTFDLIKVQAELSIRGWIGDIGHFAQTVWEFIKAYRKNWKALFVDLFNVVKSYFTNLYTNIKDFWQSVWKFITTGEADFKWTGLLDGFESALDELPDIADRKLTEAEKKLAARRDDLFKSFAQKLAEREAARKGSTAPGLFGPIEGAGDAAAAGKRGRLAALESRFLSLSPGATLSAPEKAQVETARSMKQLIREMNQFRIVMERQFYQQQRNSILT